MKKKLWEGILFILTIRLFVIPLCTVAITEKAICWSHRTLSFYDVLLEVVRKIRGNVRSRARSSNGARRTQRSLRPAHFRTP